MKFKLLLSLLLFNVVMQASTLNNDGSRTATSDNVELNLYVQDLRVKKAFMAEQAKEQKAKEQLSQITEAPRKAEQAKILEQKKQEELKNEKERLTKDLFSAVTHLRQSRPTLMNYTNNCYNAYNILNTNKFVQDSPKLKQICSDIGDEIDPYANQTCFDSFCCCFGSKAYAAQKIEGLKGKIDDALLDLNNAQADLAVIALAEKK